MKPREASGYRSDAVELIQQTTLYLATKLGDLRDDCVLVGGLVPSLIIPQGNPALRSRHVGTMDVDLGLAIALLDEQRYHELCERLRAAGFTTDINVAGRATNQRWKIKTGRGTATVDFLIPAVAENDRGGALRNLEEGFAAIITPGLELAFQDRRLVSLEGTTLHGEQAQRELWVCEAGAYVVLKALAFDSRGENKDAYDLAYVLQNYGESIDDIVIRMRPLLASAMAQRALEILRRDFSQAELVGVRRVADFLGEGDSDEVRADIAGLAALLIRRCDETT